MKYSPSVMRDSRRNASARCNIFSVGVEAFFLFRTIWRPWKTSAPEQSGLTKDKSEMMGKLGPSFRLICLHSRKLTRPIKTLVGLRFGADQGRSSTPE